MSYTVTDITLNQLPIVDYEFHPILCTEEEEPIIIKDLLSRGCDSHNLDSGNGMLTIYNRTLARFSHGYCETNLSMLGWFNVSVKQPLAIPVDDLI